MSDEIDKKWHYFFFHKCGAKLKALQYWGNAPKVKVKVRGDAVVPSMAYTYYFKYVNHILLVVLIMKGQI